MTRYPNASDLPTRAHQMLLLAYKHPSEAVLVELVIPLLHDLLFEPMTGYVVKYLYTQGGLLEYVAAAFSPQSSSKLQEDCCELLQSMFDWCESHADLHQLECSLGVISKLLSSIQINASSEHTVLPVMSALTSFCRERPILNQKLFQAGGLPIVTRVTRVWKRNLQIAIVFGTLLANFTCYDEVYSRAVIAEGQLFSHCSSDVRCTL